MRAERGGGAKCICLLAKARLVRHSLEAKNSQTHEGLVEQNWPLGKKTLTLLASGLLMDTLTVPAVRAQVTAV